MTTKEIARLSRAAILATAGLFIICMCIVYGVGLRTTKAQEQPRADPPPAVHEAIPIVTDRFTVSWQDVGGDLQETIHMMLLKDGSDGKCYLFTETQSVGPQVPCK